MRIKADIANCVGHARCCAVAPALFVLDEEGYLRTSLIDVPEGQEALAERAIRACPEGILTKGED